MEIPYKTSVLEKWRRRQEGDMINIFNGTQEFPLRILLPAGLATK